jgi:hypothetical protein
MCDYHRTGHKNRYDSRKNINIFESPTRFELSLFVDTWILESVMLLWSES